MSCVRDIPAFSTGLVEVARLGYAKDIPPGIIFLCSRPAAEAKRVQAIWEAVCHLPTAPRFAGMIPGWLMKNRRWLRINKSLLRLEGGKHGKN